MIPTIQAYTMTADEHAAQGYQHLSREEYATALDAFQQALALESTHVESLYGSARAKFKLEQFNDSVDDFDRLVNLIPNKAVYYSERGVALHLAYDNQRALQDFDKAVELEPENPYRYSSRAYIKDRMQDYQGAIDDYSKAIELDPEDAVAYNNRGIIEEKQGHLARSKKSFQRADALGSTFDHTQQNTPPPTPIAKIDTPISSEKPSTKDYLQVMKSALTSREGFNEFLSFLRRK